MPTDTDVRISEWRATLDADTLWPDSTVPQRLAAYARILEVTRDVLAGRPARLDSAAGADTRALGVAAFLSGMGALLAWWIEQGSVSASAEASRMLAAHLAHGRRRLARTTDETRRLLAQLAKRGIVPTILKGAYTARRYFVDPAARPASDLDLLATPAELEGTRGVFGELGWACRVREVLPFREEWAPAGQTAVQSLDLAHESNPWGVDLHLSLDRTYFPGLDAGLGTPDASMLTAWPSPFGMARVLAQPFLAAHLALNAGSDLPDAQLLKAVELICVIRQDIRSGELLWPKLRDLFRGTGTLRFAYPGLAMAEWLSPGAVDPDLLREVAAETTPRMRRTTADALQTLPLHRHGRSVEHYLAFAKGPREVARRLFDFMYPVTRPSPRELLALWRRRIGSVLTGRVRWDGRR